MYAVILAATLSGPLAADVARTERVARLGGDFNFRIDGRAARACRTLARAHPSVMREEVKAWNPKETVWAWEAECEWRRACWDELDTALNCRPGSVYVNGVLITPEQTDTYRLQALAKLRTLIGDEAFFAGQMPDPIPRYRTGPPD